MHSRVTVTQIQASIPISALIELVGLPRWRLEVSGRCAHNCALISPTLHYLTTPRYNINLDTDFQLRIDGGA